MLLRFCLTIHHRRRQNVPFSTIECYQLLIYRVTCFTAVVLESWKKVRYLAMMGWLRNLNQLSTQKISMKARKSGIELNCSFLLVQNEWRNSQASRNDFKNTTGSHSKIEAALWLSMRSPISSDFIKLSFCFIGM